MEPLLNNLHFKMWIEGQSDLMAVEVGKTFLRQVEAMLR